jgi:energy-coupling factor transport system permease protein
VHPVALLSWAASAGLAAALTANPFYLAPLGAAALAVGTSLARDRRPLRAFALAAALAVALRTALALLGPVSRGSLAAAALEGARLAVVLLVVGAFNASADPGALLRLAPGRWHELALAVSLALSIAPRTAEAGARVREAQRLRGLRTAGWRALPALAVPVLETGMEEAVTLAESMDARGHGSGRRTRYRPEPWRARDVVATAACGAGGAAFLAAELLDRGAVDAAGGGHVSLALLGALGLLTAPLWPWPRR